MKQKIKSTFFSFLYYTFIVFTILFLFIVPKGISGDGLPRYTFIKQLATGQFIEPLSKYSIVGSIFSLPLVFLESFFQNIQIACLYNVFLFLLFFIALIRIFKNIISRELLFKWFISLVYFQFIVIHLTTFYSETFSSLCLFLAICLFFIPNHSNKFLAVILITLSAANTPAFIIPSLFLYAYVAYDQRKLRIILFIFAPITIILIENKIMRGGYFITGYKNDHGFATILPYSGEASFSLPFWIGLFSILFSFGKGLVFFIPFLFFKIPAMFSKTAINKLYIGSLICTICLVCFYSKWWSWYGGVFWGPRFFLFSTLFASFVLVLTVQKENLLSYSHKKIFAVSIAFCLSAWVALSSILSISIPIPKMIFDNNYMHEHMTWYTPQFSVLGYPIIHIMQYGLAFNTLIDKFSTILYLILWISSFLYLGYDLFAEIYRRLKKLLFDSKDIFVQLKY